jgi:hypothetical protein
MTSDRLADLLVGERDGADIEGGEQALIGIGFLLGSEGIGQAFGLSQISTHPLQAAGQSAAENLSLRVRQIQGNSFGAARRLETGHGSYASGVLDGSSRSNAAGRRSMRSSVRLAGCRAYTKQLVLVQDFPDASRV